MKIFGAAAFILFMPLVSVGKAESEFPNLRYSDREPGSLYRPPIMQKENHDEARFADRAVGCEQEASPSERFTGIIVPKAGIDYSLLTKFPDLKVDPSMIKNPDARENSLTRR